MRRTGSAIGGVTAVVASLAVVALASRGDPGDRSAAAFEAASVGRTAFFSALGVALVICAALAVWALWPDGSGAPKKPTPPSRWLPYLVMTGLLLLLAVFAPERPPPPEGGEPASASALTDGTDERDEAPAPQGRASATVSLVVIALAVAGLAAFTLVLRRRRDDAADDRGVDVDVEDGPGEAPSPLDASLVATIGAGNVEAAIAAVAAEPDPRRAVLLAYAVLDARLATTAAARLPTSTPHEWLQRIRSTFATTHPDLVASSRRLTAMYERARFGNRPMTPGHRNEAVDALEALRSLTPSDASS